MTQEWVDKIVAAWAFYHPEEAQSVPGVNHPQPATEGSSGQDSPVIADRDRQQPDGVRERSAAVQKVQSRSTADDSATSDHPLDPTQVTQSCRGTAKSRPAPSVSHSEEVTPPPAAGGGEPVRPVTYRVEIRTSYVEGAGTAADVQLAMHGADTDGATHVLTGGSDSFGRCDTIVLPCGKDCWLLCMCIAASPAFLGYLCVLVKISGSL